MDDIDKRIKTVEEKLALLREWYMHPPEGRTRISVELQARPLKTLLMILQKRRNKIGIDNQQRLVIE